MIYVTSDHHFGHKNIIKYTQRPFDGVHEMDEEMIKIWNEHISEFDTVVHLGDFYFHNNFKRISEITEQLNGKKYLLLGNHDKMRKRQYERAGFEFVGDFLIKNVFGKNILFNHYPVSGNREGNIMVRNILSKEPIDYIIHGHKHRENPQTDEFENHFNVCVDLHNFRPILLEDILKKLMNNDN